MLVLSRKKGQTTHFFVGGGIAVTIHKVQGNKVWLAIDCDKEIPVFRSEVIQKMAESGQDLPKHVLIPDVQ